jgi:hypothetical protein
MKSQKSLFSFLGNSSSKNILGRLYVFFAKNPVNLLYSGLFLVVMLFSYQNTFSKKKQLESSFMGKIEFGTEASHRLLTKDATAEYTTEGGVPVLTIKATDEQNLESVYLRLQDVTGPGTYFIPGNGKNNNIGNIIKNLNNYQDKDNFYVATLPNADGVLSGVGRINISKLSEDVVEGNLILITYNTKGEQALLESAKFSIAIK